MHVILCISFSDTKYKCVLIPILAVSCEIGSVWLDESSVPQLWSTNWQNFWGPGEPDNSGSCVYLSKSRLVYYTCIEKK